MILQISPDTHDHNRIKNVKDYFKSTLILLYLLVYARMSRRACPTLRRLAGRLYSSLGRTAVPASSHGRKGLTCRSGSCGRSLHLRQTLSCRRQMVPGNKQITLFFFLLLSSYYNSYYNASVGASTVPFSCLSWHC